MAGPLSPALPNDPVPTTVEMTPVDWFTSRVRLFPLSAMYRFPAEIDGYALGIREVRRNRLCTVAAVTVGSVSSHSSNDARGMIYLADSLVGFVRNEHVARRIDSDTVRYVSSAAVACP